MVVIAVILTVGLLVALIAVGKVNPFLAFLLVSFFAGLLLGIPVGKITQSIEKGIGDTMGSLLIILCTGAMLGKLIAETGAAHKIADTLMNLFGVKHIQWAMMAAGFIVGIPLFYGIGFVLMVPLIFSVTYRYKLPAVYVGLPMLAALSVTHGFLPPHPSPTALVQQLGANMSLTLVYGILVAIPAIIIAGPVFSSSLKNMVSQPLDTFTQHQPRQHALVPGTFNSFFTALLPVLLLSCSLLYGLITPAKAQVGIMALLNQPDVVMMLTIIYATFALGLKTGKSMVQVMDIYITAVKDIGMILIIIAGSGALKQILTDSGASMQVATLLQHISLPPLFLGWLMAAVIRACVGSATVAGLTTGGIILPLIAQSQTNPNLMVLAVGAGSLMFSHVNDSGFWMFKEYFNLSVKDTLRSWSVMEALVSVVGLCGILLLNVIIK